MLRRGANALINMQPVSDCRTGMCFGVLGRMLDHCSQIGLAFSLPAVSLKPGYTWAAGKEKIR